MNAMHPLAVFATTPASPRWSAPMPASLWRRTHWLNVSIWPGDLASACTSTRPRIRSTSGSRASASAAGSSNASLESGLLDVPNTILAHGTHFSDSDFAAVNERESLLLAHNPSSNMNNGVGYTPVAKLSRPPLLGTDGIGADMWREARVAEFKSHDAGLPLPFGSSLKMLAQSARFASQCLGVKLGVLEPGAAADLVLTDYRPATPLRDDSLASHFLFAMGPEFVRSVMIGGRWSLKDRIVLTCDEAAVRAQSIEVTRALYERMAEL